jgi:predicted aspartyl protease
MKVIIPFEIYPVANGCHLKVDVIINNKKASLIIDTGASVSVFDEDKVSKLSSRRVANNGAISAGAGNDAIEQKEVMIDHFQIGMIYIKDYSATVIDLSHINQAYENLGIDHIDGILGGDILNPYKAVIDYSKKELLLYDF